MHPARCSAAPDSVRVNNWLINVKRALLLNRKSVADGISGDGYVYRIVK
jgi:hypothetical protein